VALGFTKSKMSRNLMPESMMASTWRCRVGKTQRHSQQQRPAHSTRPGRPPPLHALPTSGVVALLDTSGPPGPLSPLVTLIIQRITCACRRKGMQPYFIQRTWLLRPSRTHSTVKEVVAEAPTLPAAPTCVILAPYSEPAGRRR
jgi:hypothetical protein